MQFIRQVRHAELLLWCLDTDALTSIHHPAAVYTSALTRNLNQPECSRNRSLDNNLCNVTCMHVRPMHAPSTY